MTTTTSEYTMYPKVKPTGELPPKVLEHLDARFWNHDQELPVGAGGNGTAVDARKYGAKGNGSTNDATALQAALDAAAGKALFIPAGRYLVDGVAYLRVQAGTTVFGEPGTVLVQGSSVVENIFRAFGSTGVTADLATAVNAGANELTTKTAHRLAQGDVVRLISQRVSTSDDAGEDRLGWATVGGQGPFFSEFVRVQDVLSTTKIRLDRGLVFNGYRPDATRETSPDAGTSAKLVSTNGTGDRVTIRDLELVGQFSMGAVRLIRSNESRVERVTVRVTARGRAVGLEDCYRTEIRDCHAYASEMLYDAADHALQNVFHVAACQSSGLVGCSTTWGAQPYDFTYRSSTPYPSVFCYVKQCASYGALFNPMTLHPGTYGCEITDNNFSECRSSGLSIRGNSSIVANNRITGSGNYTTSSNPYVGIYCLEGGGKNSIITGNVIEGFSAGLRVNDGGGKPFQGWIGTQFVGNVIRDFSVGFYRMVGSGTPVPTVPQGITLANNLFESRQDGAVAVLTCENGFGVRGLTIQGNTVRLTGSSTVGVKVTANSLDTVVSGNTFAQVGQALAWDEAGWKADSSQSVVHWSGNTIISTDIDRFPPPSDRFQVHSSDDTVMRMPDTAYSLNYALHSGRYYATSSAASMGRGWPVEGFEGHVDVVRVTSSLVIQTGWGADGRRHARTWTAAGGWTNWRAV